MQNLVRVVNSTSEVNQELIEEYFKRNERRKEDEKWLKKHRKLIVNELQELGRDVVDFGNIRVSVTIPDTSKFDKEKVLEFAEKNGFKDKVIREELDEDKLVQLIESGEVDLEELKEYAWIESTGSPRVTLKELGR